MIESPPATWQELQNRVAAILDETGMVVEVEKDVQTVRDRVNIDVYAEDHAQRPPAKLLCECKHWKSAVPKTIVHALRTVVGDTGANWGFIISSNGFQSGAYEAAENSNIQLLCWEEFQEMFAERWWDSWAISRIERSCEPLMPFTDTLIGPKIGRVVDGLSKADQQRFGGLYECHSVTSFFALRYYLSARMEGMPRLPISGLSARHQGLPQNVLRQTLLRPFVDELCSSMDAAVSEFRMP